MTKFRMLLMASLLVATALPAAAQDAGLAASATQAEQLLKEGKVGDAETQVESIVQTLSSSPDVAKDNDSAAFAESLNRLTYGFAGKGNEFHPCAALWARLI